jgi:hypothetical protein
MLTKTAPLARWFVLVFALGSCDPAPEFTEVQDVMGYAPIYGTEESPAIAMGSARSVGDPGKIYLYGKYLLVNEISEGIHVFDNSDPSDPRALGFLELPGNTDMAMKDGLLYADVTGHIVSLSVNDFGLIEEKGRLPLGTFPLGIPPPRGSYFECIDPARGIVVSWQKTQLHNPDCYAN